MVTLVLDVVCRLVHPTCGPGERRRSAGMI
jgi:hypothetical protein